MANTYTKGTNVQVSASFKLAGTLVDPDPLTVRVEDPAETAASYLYITGGTTVVKSATGIYYLNVNASTVGTWHYRFESGSTNRGAEEGTFEVRKSQFA